MGAQPVTVVGITMVRDEADIIEPVIRHMLGHCDRVIVADNLSTDDTRPIIDRIADGCDRLTVVDDPEPGYYQSAKMTALASMAADMAATWVVPFDADEVFVPPTGRIADVLAALPDEVDIVEATVYHHVPTGDLAAPGHAIARYPWRQTIPGPRNVICRVVPGLVIEQGNHAAYSTARDLTWTGTLFKVHHYPYRTVEQYVRKLRQGAAAYAAAPDLPDWMGGHWKDWGNRSDVAIAEQFFRYYVADPEASPSLIYDPPTLMEAL